MEMNVTKTEQKLKFNENSILWYEQINSYAYGCLLGVFESNIFV